VRPKYVSFSYIGSGVGALKKGQCGPQKDKLKKIFHGVHLEMQVRLSMRKHLMASTHLRASCIWKQIDSIDDFSQKDIGARLLARYK
jgi:hypothetical protein